MKSYEDLQFSGIEFVWGHDLILFAANALNRIMETVVATV